MGASALLVVLETLPVAVRLGFMACRVK